MRIVDLTMPIAPHFRWPTEVAVKGDIGTGEQFRVTRLSASCHSFTHVDAQAHFIPDAPTIEATELSQVVGPCRILDLRDTPANTPIEPDRLAAADPGGPEGDILLLSVGWDRHRDPATPAFWTESPWLTRNSAEWLLARKPKSVAVDFPQDFPIRLMLEGKSAPNEEQVTHDVLLRAGITLIEYLVNTTALAGPRTFLCAAPLKIPHADGAPARVFAIEGLDRGH